MKFRAELDYTEDEPENPATKEEIDQEFVYLLKRLSHTKTISKVQEGVMRRGRRRAETSLWPLSLSGWNYV
jgi:hypothetical protein